MITLIIQKLGAVKASSRPGITERLIEICLVKLELIIQRSLVLPALTDDY